MCKCLVEKNPTTQTKPKQPKRTGAAGTVSLILPKRFQHSVKAAVFEMLLRAFLPMVSMKIKLIYTTMNTKIKNVKPDGQTICTRHT